MKKFLALFLFATFSIGFNGCRRGHRVEQHDASASALTPSTEKDVEVATEPVDVVIPGHGPHSGAPSKEGPEMPSAFDTTEDVEDGHAPAAPKPLVSIVDSGLGSKAGAVQSGVDDKLSETVGTTFKLTYYHISLRPSGDANEVELRDCKGNFLTWASRAWRADAIMEGTARYNSGGESKSINIADGAGTCWIPLTWEERWGLGVWNSSTQTSYKLRPFRSIAIDRRELVMGAWYYVKDLDGVKMPYPVSTMTHNGCVRAMDVGTAVLGKHIDFYAAYASAYQAIIGTVGTPMYRRYNVTLFSGRTKCKAHIDRGY